MRTFNVLELSDNQLNACCAVAEGWVPPTDPLIGALRLLLKEKPGAAKVGDHEPLWLPSRDLHARFMLTPPQYTGSRDLTMSILLRERYRINPATNTTWVVEGWKPYADYEGMDPMFGIIRVHVHRRFGFTFTEKEAPWLAAN